MGLEIQAPPFVMIWIFVGVLLFYLHYFLQIHRSTNNLCHVVFLILFAYISLNLILNHIEFILQYFSWEIYFLTPLCCIFLFGLDRITISTELGYFFNKLSSKYFQSSTISTTLFL